MNPSRTSDVLRSALSLVTLVSGISLFTLGCAAADDHAPSLPESDAEAPHVNVTGSCGTETACPCTTPGEVIECRAYRKSGDYVACSPGTRTCGEDARWGDCLGDAIAK